MVALLMAVLAHQAEPAPAAPDPAHPAEPAPPSFVPLPQPDPEEPEPAFAFSPWLAAAFRTAPADVDPRWGFALGLSIDRRLARLGSRVEIGVGLDAAYHRFAKSVPGAAVTEDGSEIPFDGVQTISQASFGIAPLVALHLRRVRTFVGGGGGLSVAYFTSDLKDLRPGQQDAILSYLRATVGVGLDVAAATSIVLRAQYTHLILPPTFQTATGQDLDVFGDLLDAGLAVRFEF